MTIRRLAEEEGCSKRTVYRDIDALSAAGFPIYSENVNGTVRYRFMDGSIYLIGYCHKRNEFRTFLLDRINALEVTDKRFVPRDDFSFEEYIGNSFKVFREEELVEVVVDFDKSIKQLIREKIWHPSQEICDNSDGSIRVTFRVAGITEIKHWLLGFGAKAKVLEPTNLREEISNEARALLGHYKMPLKKRPMAEAPIRRKAPIKAQYQLKLK